MASSCQPGNGLDSSSQHVARLTVFLRIHVVERWPSSSDHLAGLLRDLNEGIMDVLEVWFCHSDSQMVKVLKYKERVTCMLDLGKIFHGSFNRFVYCRKMTSYCSSIICKNVPQ